MHMVFSGFMLLSKALIFKGKNCWADCCLEVQLSFVMGPHLTSQ